MRPVFLTFGSSDSQPRHADMARRAPTSQPFAHMIENRFLIDALVDGMRG